jgi:hypothetical protein
MVPTLPVTQSQSSPNLHTSLPIMSIFTANIHQFYLPRQGYFPVIFLYTFRIKFPFCKIWYGLCILIYNAYTSCWPRPRYVLRDRINVIKAIKVLKVHTSKTLHYKNNRLFRLWWAVFIKSDIACVARFYKHIYILTFK